MTVTFDENGFAIESGEITVYQADYQGVFIGESTEFISEGGGLATNSYLDAPPEEKQGFAIIRTETGWAYQPDYRGQKAYSILNGSEFTIQQLGELPENSTLLKPENDCYEWNAKTQNWQISPAKQTALFAQRKSELLKQIANKTDELTNQYLASYSKAEIDSFYRQEREARGELPLMLLTEIFAGRDDLENIEQLKKKVIDKADVMAIIMGKLFAIKQTFERRIETATNQAELDQIQQEIEQWQDL